jgi:hypothetical protein
MNQEAWCKTMAQNEYGLLRDELARRRSGSECARSSAQAVTALGTARLEDGTTCTGAHTMSEPVLTGSAAVVWLKGALHGGSLYWAPRRAMADKFFVPLVVTHMRSSRVRLRHTNARRQPAKQCCPRSCSWRAMSLLSVFSVVHSLLWS